LQRLGGEHSDLYQFDHETSIQETLNALYDVVRSGEVRYVGALNLHAWQLMRAIGFRRAKGRSTFVSIQNYLLNRDESREMLSPCLSEGVGAIPWSPPARDRLRRPLV
jgi:aryl-alcohol dehydrogenase-like predicted oxidoreductase